MGFTKVPTETSQGFIQCIYGGLKNAKLWPYKLEKDSVATENVTLIKDVPRKY